MAQRNQKVYDRVRQELSKNPQLGSRELYEMAQGMDKSIGQDSLQQFHARYVLPAKREQSKSGAARQASQPARRARGERKSAAAADAGTSGAGRRRGRPAATAVPGTDRDRIRNVLLQFAQELANARNPSSLVQVLARVDTYVDRIAPK